MTDKIDTKLQWEIATKAVDVLNSTHKVDFTIKYIKDYSDYSFKIKVIDNEMRQRMQDANIKFIDYIPEFEVEIGKSYFWSHRLEPFDAAVGISGKDLPIEKKALIRCAWRIMHVNKQWRAEIFKNHPELK